MSQNTTFYELEKQIYKLVCNLGCELIKQILENQDKEIMKVRDKKEYRHKGYRKNVIKSIMGEIEYNRAIYLKGSKYTFLLDKEMQVNVIGKFSYNIVEKMLESIVDMPSYRSASKQIISMTNETVTHEALRNIVYSIGKEIEAKEKEEIKLMKQNKLTKGTKEVPAIFEEADGIWINLQGKDRQKMIEKYKKQCERKNKEFNPNKKVKTELKLHVTYEGWKAGDKRHTLVNKKYISGMITPGYIKKLRDARIYREYNVDKIKLRAMNGDGAKWINNIKAEKAIYQKDLFHIQQEIVRDVPKEYQNLLLDTINNKEYDKISDIIKGLKYELHGEEKVVKKLDTLKSYLSTGLERYQDVVKSEGKELPIPPQDLEYRSMGTMESQIYTVLEKRFCSGRKAFSITGANYLSKVCAVKVENRNEIELQKIESEIKIDNSVEEYIKEIEENVKRNKTIHRANLIKTEKENYAQATININEEIRKLLKFTELTSMKCKF